MTEVVPIVVRVIEKAGGPPDEAGVQQREAYAEDTFETVRELARTDGMDVETVLRYGTDIAEAIHDAADEFDASAIGFRSRGDSRWPELVGGRVRSRLVAGSEPSVIVLSERER